MPVRLEVCGVAIALSATCSAPVLVPVAVGVKTTLILQLVLAARLVPQVVVETLKSPVVEITTLFSATFCLLARVNTFAALVVVTFCAAKIAVTGITVACGSPVPESDTICGLFEALSVNVTLPVSAPSCSGMKVSFMTQLFPGSRGGPHVFEAI